MTGVITMTELTCSWQENVGANSIEILTLKKQWWWWEKKKKKLKFGGISVTCPFKC